VAHGWPDQGEAIFHAAKLLELGARTILGVIVRGRDGLTDF
jgi:hypothetical protein